MKYSLDELRERINNLDKALLFVILQRMAIMPLVAEVKKREQIPILQPEREKKIYSSLEKFAADHGINQFVLEEIYDTIMAESKDIENSDLASFEKIYDFFQYEGDKNELINLFNASYLRLLEFSSIMECMKSWHSRSEHYGKFSEFVATLTKDEMNKKYNEEELAMEEVSIEQ